MARGLFQIDVDGRFARYVWADDCGEAAREGARILIDLGRVRDGQIVTARPTGRGAVVVRCRRGRWSVEPKEDQ